MSNVITPTISKIYLLTDGSIRDPYNPSGFHPLSNVNTIQVFVEDGEATNVMTINYAPAIRTHWASHWFPCFYRGLVEHTLDGESEPRTFAQYLAIMPNPISSLNQNNSTNMTVSVTVQQQTGVNLIGSYNTVEDLPTSYGDWLDLQDLEEAGAIAYVWESGTNGFYKVVYDSVEETYDWEIVTESIQNEVSTKGYNVWDTYVQPGYGNPKPQTNLVDEQYRLIWQEFGILTSTIETFTNLVTSYENRVFDLEKASENSTWNLEDAIDTALTFNTRAGYCQVDNVVYFFGGILFDSGSVNYLNSNRVFKYDLDTRTYTELNNLPYTWYMNEMRCVHVDGVIYIFGGLGFTAEPDPMPSYYNINTHHNLKYTIATDTYELLPDAPDVFAHCSGAVYVESEDAFYVMVDKIIVSDVYTTINTKPYKYNLTAETWDDTLTASAQTFDRGFSYYYDGKVYVQRSLKFESYDIDTDTWDSTLTPPTYGNVHTGLMIEHNGYLVIGSGWESAESANSPYFQYYDVANDEWFILNRLEYELEAIGYGTMVLRNNKIYYLNGYSSETDTVTNKYIFSFPLENSRLDEFRNIRPIINANKTRSESNETNIENIVTANMFKTVSYASATGILTFTHYDDTTTQIDLPLELLIESGYYDEDANNIVLVLADSSEILIPAGDLLTDLDADNVRYDNSSGLTATNVQDALDELVTTDGSVRDEMHSVGEETITYRDDGKISSVVADTVTTTPTYDVNGNLTKITEVYALDGKTYETTFVRDALGRIINTNKQEVI